MAFSFCEKYQVTNLLEHLKVIYRNEVDDAMIEALKKYILEGNEDASVVTEEIKSLFEYDANKLAIFLIKHHVPVKGNLEILMSKKKDSLLKKIESLKEKGFTMKQQISISLLILILECNMAGINLGHLIKRPFTIVPSSSSMEEFIEQSVNENKNLKEEEREIFKIFETYLNENPYINKKDIYFNLKNLDIDYKKLKNEYVDGTYRSFSNRIDIYNFVECKGENEIRKVLGHEIFHTLSSNGYDCGFSTFHGGRSLNEGMTEILTEEYLLERAKGITITYQEETILVKIMAELIGADVLLYGYSNQDIDIIIEKLGALDGNIDKAKTVINLMDKMTYENHFQHKETAQEYKEQIYLILKDYYQIKVAENPKKAQILTYLIESFYHINHNNSIFCYNLTKAYFSEKLKSMYIPKLQFINRYYDLNIIKKELPPELNVPITTITILENDMPIGELAQEKRQK